MGVGKTTFARALAQGLGIEGVTSPTFAILHEYAGPVLPLYHFDAYRLTGSGELYDIGFEEYLERNGVVIIEWPEIVADALPSERLDITIAGSGEAPRVIGITPHGELYKETLRLMNEGLPC
jgi:tRNA threonylcarbamoyladenosine biosynthesis protein TsaE